MTQKVRVIAWSSSVFLFLISGSPPSVGVVTLGPAVGMAYMHPSPVVTHTLSAEMVEGETELNRAIRRKYTYRRRLESSPRDSASRDTKTFHQSQDVKFMEAALLIRIKEHH